MSNAAFPFVLHNFFTQTSYMDCWSRPKILKSDGQQDRPRRSLRESLFTCARVHTNIHKTDYIIVTRKYELYLVYINISWITRTSCFYHRSNKSWQRLVTVDMIECGRVRRYALQFGRVDLRADTNNVDHRTRSFDGSSFEYRSSGFRRVSWRRRILSRVVQHRRSKMLKIFK